METKIRTDRLRQLAEHLFYPHSQNIKWGKLLKTNATKKSVANNILKFCDLAEKGEL